MVECPHTRVPRTGPTRIGLLRNLAEGHLCAVRFHRFQFEARASTADAVHLTWPRAKRPVPLGLHSHREPQKRAVRIGGLDGDLGSFVGD